MLLLDLRARKVMFSDAGPQPPRAGLRRDLVNAGLLARESDGSRYWRTDASRDQSRLVLEKP